MELLVQAVPDFWQLEHTKKKFGFMYSQKRNSAASVPISTFMCLWAIYILPRSAHLFSCSRIGRPIRGIYNINHSQKHECRNWDCSRTVPFLEIFVSNFRYCVFAVQPVQVRFQVCSLVSDCASPVLVRFQVSDTQFEHLGHIYFFISNSWSSYSESGLFPVSIVVEA